MNVTTNSGPAFTAGKGCMTLFLSVFAIMGLMFTAFIGRAGFDTVRAYFWDRTDCVIEASSFREKGDGYEFDVRYAYRVSGLPYTGTRFSMGMAPSMDGEKAQRAAATYAPGNGAVCYVNPSSPGESVLERGALWMLLFMLIPLLFVVFGVVGIIGVWRTKPASAKPVSERHRSGAGATIGLRLFGAIFMCVGGGLLYAMLIRPTMKEAAAANWPQVPCEVTSSRVASHRGSKGGSTYSVEIRYRYDFKGHSYDGTRYNFDTGNSSSRGWRAEAVAKHPPGTRTLCHVNPEDPVEAVLSVKPSPERWFGLIPGLFLIVGLFVFFKAPAMTNRSTSRTGLPFDALPRLPRDLATGEVELKPASSPLTGFIVLFIVALVWNGIVWGFLLTMGKGEILPRIFLGLFALIGAGIAAGVVYQFLALFNPRPILAASAQVVPLGGTLGVHWRFTGNVRRLVKFTIVLEGREEATYRRGTSTTTDRNVFAILLLIDTADRAQIPSGNTKITIPRELIHTFTAPNNKIVWTLRLAGDVPRWPDVKAEFPITVMPRDAATLFTAENPAT